MIVVVFVVAVVVVVISGTGVECTALLVSNVNVGLVDIFTDSSAPPSRETCTDTQKGKITINMILTR
jgi:hypothetical protein